MPELSRSAPLNAPFPAEPWDLTPKNAGRTRSRRNSFIDRYVPDGELHEVGSVASTIQRSGPEVRHLESLREHYALTLQA
jgi:cyclopropane fatty-acyl-phospholipid synthase-like methyltransferase